MHGAGGRPQDGPAKVMAVIEKFPVKVGGLRSRQQGPDTEGGAEAPPSVT